MNLSAIAWLCSSFFCTHPKDTIIRRIFVSPQSMHCCLMSVQNLFLSLSVPFQVYKCSLSSRTPSQKAVPAATGRSRTVTCWRPLISTGMRTASSVPAVTAGWARLAPRSTPKPISSCAEETTYGKTDSIHLHGTCVWHFGTNTASR